MVFLDGGMGFLLERILILSMPTTEAPPKCDWIRSLRDWMLVVLGSRDGRVSVMFGLREDLSVSEIVDEAGAEPGAAALEGVDFGG